MIFYQEIPVYHVKNYNENFTHMKKISLSPTQTIFSVSGIPDLKADISDGISQAFF